MEEYKKTLLTDPMSVKAVSLISNNVDDTVIGATIRSTQKLYLQEIIGSELFGKLQQLVYATISGEHPSIDDPESEAYATLLDEYVEPYLIAKTQSEILIPITFKIRNIGVSTDSDTNVNSSILSEVKYLKRYYDSLANEDASRLSKFLCANKSDYPELEVKCDCGGFVAPRIGKNYGRTGLWLGEDDTKCCNR